MDDLLAEFVAETRDMLDALGSEIVAWEADPSDGARLDAIFRFVHTVKGNCGFFDFPRLEKLSHATEGTLAEVRAGRRQADPALVTAVLAIIDRIGEMIEVVDAGGEFPEGGDEALIAALEPDAEIIELSQSEDRVADPARSASGNGGSPPRSIRLPVALLDRVMSGVSDLVLARNDLARRLSDLGAEPQIIGPFERLSAILDDVRDSITRVRMQRIEYLFGTLPRLVRDLSAELGKQVMIDFEGGNVELDREMIEMIRDPVVHIIRNCLDHGIEAPSERLAVGKREIGLLQISARQTGNKIILAIADDGRGIDDEKLVSKAVTAGLVEKDEAAKMSLLKRHELIFEPGLSTAEAVTSISGRGVGMDVVRANIERVGGEVYASSKRGEGTTIFLRLPLTLSIIPALTVGIGDQMFAFPRAHIEEIVDAGSEELEFVQAGDQVQLRWREQWVPCLWTGDLIGIAGTQPPSKGLLLVAKLGNGAMLAAAVDSIHDHADIVIKPLASPVMGVGIYSGTTLLDDGAPMLMLDIVGLMRYADIDADGQTSASSIASDEEAVSSGPVSVPVLSFAGADGRRRVVRMELVDRIEKVQRSAIEFTPARGQVVIDGAIVPLAGASKDDELGDEVSLLRLSDGKIHLAYVVTGEIDTGAIDGEIAVTQSQGDYESVTLVDGAIAELLDCHRLFAEFGCAPDQSKVPICRLPLGEPWVDSILRPLVETAGYQILGTEDPGQADLAITISDSESDLRGEQTIRLRDHPAEDNATSGTIYRYDRESLISALAEVRSRRSA